MAPGDPAFLYGRPKQNMRNRTDLTLRYACAVVSIAVAIAVRLVLDPILGDKTPYPTVFLAILVAASYGGFGPAVVATLLGAIASSRFLLPPRDSFAIEGFDNQVGMVLYLGSGFGIALLGGAMRQSQRRAESNAQELLVKQNEIEKALQERLRAEKRLHVTLQSIGDAVISTDGNWLESGRGPGKTASRSVQDCQRADP
jgi:K+-sensing histidine kinase KdpD